MIDKSRMPSKFRAAATTLPHRLRAKTALGTLTRLALAPVMSAFPTTREAYPKITSHIHHSAHIDNASAMQDVCTSTK